MNDIKEITQELKNLRHEFRVLQSKVLQKYEDDKPTVVLHMRQIKQRLNYGQTWFDNNLERLIKEIPLYRTQNTHRWYCKEQDLERFINKKL